MEGTMRMEGTLRIGRARHRVVALGLVVVGGCDLAVPGNEEPELGGRAQREQIVARAGQVTVTRGQLLDAVMSEPITVRRRFDGSRDEKKKYVTRLVGDELVYEEALRRGVDRRPGLRKTLMRLVTAELRREIEEEIRAARPSEEQVLAQFEAIRGRYETGLAYLVQLRTYETEAAARAAHTSLLAGGIESTGKAGWRRIGYVDRESKQVDPRLVDQVMALKQEGDVSAPMLVGGVWTIARVERVRHERRASLEKLRPIIEARLVRERTTRAMERLREEQVRKARVAIDDKELDETSAGTPAEQQP